MKRVFILLIPCIIVYFMFILSEATSIFNSINILIFLPYFITPFFIRWVKCNIDNKWFLPMSFSLSAVLLIIIHIILRNPVFAFIGMGYVMYYILPFLIITFIGAIRINKGGKFNERN